MTGKKENLYKVLDANLKSPFQNFQFEIGKTYQCADFDDNKNVGCSTGFYATNLEGLTYSYRPGKKIFACQCWGKSVKINQFKMRYEYIRIVKEVPLSIIKRRALAAEKDLKYRLSIALFPPNPFDLHPKVTKKDIENLKKWSSVRDSVRDSVWDSVRDSVWDSVRDSVRDSVWGSVWDSVWDSVRDSVRGSVRDSVRGSVWDSVRGYISSIFPDLGENPFQSCIDLWDKGLVPSFDGKIWRLHGEKDAKILFEITVEELRAK